jgi:hypothetical protein
MIITIILLAILLIGIYIANKSYNFDLLGIVLSTVSGLYLVMHLLFWALASYDYNLFVEKRNSFVFTLESSRENKRDLESAAILKEISDWNQELASQKYNNTLFLLDDYIDDRIEYLEPIK